MSQPIAERSMERVGREWRIEDHLELAHAIREIERTVAALVRLNQEQQEARAND